MSQPTSPSPPDQSSHALSVARAGRWIGPLAAVAVFLLLSWSDPSLADAAKTTAAVGVLLAVWWMTEAMPLPATALLPLVLFPLTGVLSFDEAATPYANKFIFLFMGGFILALALERWNLHRRIALLTVLAVGTHPRRLIAGFMIATAFLSMWISNTATTVMMLPIGTSLVVLLRDRMAGSPAEPTTVDGDAVPLPPELASFAVCMMLGIAYAASIGGVGTLIGTPPNTFFAGFMNEQGIAIGFGQWMLFALPLVVVFLTLTWLMLTRLIFPIRIEQLSGGRALIRAELHKLGPMTRAQWSVLCVFSLTALAWIVREPLANWTWLVERVPAVTRVNDSIIALVAALSLFLIPVDARRGVFALDWPTARRLPWGILLLFGGGLSFAAAVEKSELAQWIGEQVSGLSALPVVVIVVCVVAIVIFLTEITSNLATASAFLPILFGVAQGIGMDPLLLLAPAALAASCAFMLPVATPPNAIVFGSGHVTIGQMMKAGIWLNLVGILLIPVLMYTIGALVFAAR